MIQHEEHDVNSSFNGWKKLSGWKRSAFPVILAAVLGGIGGPPVWRAFDDPRKDPFTGRQAETMEARIIGQSEAGDYAIRLQDSKLEGRLDRMDTRITSLTGLVANLPPDELIERVTRAEEMLKYLDRSCVKWERDTRKRQSQN